MFSRAVWIPFFVMGVVLSGCVSQESRTAILSTRFIVAVDYSRNLEESLGAGGYAWSYYQVKDENFPSAETGTATLSIDLVKTSSTADVDTLIREQSASGHRPATLKELLAFGETYPDVQNRLAVIALGSSTDLWVTSYRHIYMMNPMTMNTDMDRRVIRYYPYLAKELLGRVVNLSPVGYADDEAYTWFYACFVTTAQ